ncbi:cytochrome c3 family protein [Carboxylicivirga marina]|uniref:cytochrome c3 family protein n=1 Tax=Carboxylicivirga marina TaxID=2800988 RepID=UPI0025971A7D|nr:cytochrome c3 family protein [uncultured Carboxylicivirga sp.]
MNRLILLMMLFLMSFCVSAQITNTRHNLSVNGNGLKAGSSQSMCEFCHTPHTSKRQSPKWGSVGKRYLMYDQSVSSTSDIKVDPSRQPDGASLLCLTCHDGTIAPSSGASKGSNGGLAVPVYGRANLGTDLTDDHPISFVYDASFAAIDGQLKTSPEHPVVLDGEDKVQCTSCHDPHNNEYSNFLVATNQFSELCLKCHDRDYWTASSHATSNANWNGSGENPWAHVEAPFASVAENACANCHQTHSAKGKARLQKSMLEEKNCFDCHNGNVAPVEKNIEQQMQKQYRHNVYAYNGVHDPKEEALLSLSKKHVECQDCHNPHAVNDRTAQAPEVNGQISGVQGIDQAGNAVGDIAYEYELCYRCHSENPMAGAVTSRQIEQTNTRLEFSPSAVSFHPIAERGKSSYVPGLLNNLTESDMIYCTDCHASDGEDSPAGPHGSIYPQILKYQYLKGDEVIESSKAYELCYSCHSRNMFVTEAGDDVQQKVHYNHVVKNNISCNVCHDPHGVSEMQGSEMNHSHLINFDLNVVEPRVNGDLHFTDQGYRSGTCSIMCHGKEHDNLGY